MTEWYTYCEWGVPVEVVMGRRSAVTRLTRDWKLGPDLRKYFAYYLEGGAPDLKASIGVGDRNWEGVLERSITRCTGPGTEV